MQIITSLTYLTRTAKTLEGFFWKLWWVILVIVISLIVLEQALQALSHEHQQLSRQLANLESEIQLANVETERLKLQIDSQNDPTWVELILKQELGLVPEGQTKVLFLK